MTPRTRTLRIYETSGGSCPFILWIEGLKNLQTRAVVFARLERVKLGLLGDCKAVGDGVQELRIDVGPGYRVYFGQDGATTVILLTGGDKATQKKDVATAKMYWQEYRSRKNA
ncbi:MAG: type II toxin-antitoxin system RelE/ParE family toxin [Acidobacteriota bacterium]